MRAPLQSLNILIFKQVSMFIIFWVKNHDEWIYTALSTSTPLCGILGFSDLHRKFGLSAMLLFI